VVAGGHSILEEVDLDVQPGEHFAVVGESGAGKSSLVGLLLGWHAPERGAVLVDGEPVSGAALDLLRAETAWVDPAVQLWNRSAVSNLTYGAAREQQAGLPEALNAADLAHLLAQLPDGLQTSLGEGGGLVSGGEGQRVRLGRALLKPNARLVLLDEPFRGLDRERRRLLLARARKIWAGATLICVTHDVADTRDFDRVAVLQGGRLLEVGAPHALGAQPSRYRALCEADESMFGVAWEERGWRRLELRAGAVAGAAS
jgi:ATP-binding cassette subfamily B protein